MRIVCISDTHGRHSELVMPEGDVLVHAGDWSAGIGDMKDLDEFCTWIRQQPYEHKVVVAGNHDFPLDPKQGFANYEAARRMIQGVSHYLFDSGCKIRGLIFYGSPWQPWFGGWAFNMKRGEDLERVWNRVPPKTSVLVTHSPPRGILDRVSDGREEGCDDLLERVFEVSPKLHVFGHIHESRGVLNSGGITFVNAACCGHRVLNPPIVVEI